MNLLVIFLAKVLIVFSYVLESIGRLVFYHKMCTRYYTSDL